MRKTQSLSRLVDWRGHTTAQKLVLPCHQYVVTHSLPLYASITPLQPLTQLGPGQGNKPALVQTCPLVWYWWLSLPSVVWTMTGRSHRSVLFYYYYTTLTLALDLTDRIRHNIFFNGVKAGTKWRYPRVQYKINQDHTHIHTHTRRHTYIHVLSQISWLRLTQCLHTSSTLSDNSPEKTGLIMPEKKTMTPSARRDSFANGRADGGEEGGWSGSMGKFSYRERASMKTWCDGVPRGQVLFQLYIISRVRFLISNRAE